MDNKKKKFGFGEIIQRKNNAIFLSGKEIQLRKQEALRMLLKNRDDKAELIYLKLLKAGVKEKNIYENLFQIYNKQQRFSDAKGILKKLITIDSKYAILSIELSKNILKIGN